MTRRRHTHRLHAYVLTDSSEFELDLSLPVEAHPPRDGQEVSRQVQGGIVTEANMIVHSNRPEVDAIEDGQSVVLERIGDGHREPYIVTTTRVYGGRHRSDGEWELRLDREDGGDLSMYPEA